MKRCLIGLYAAMACNAVSAFTVTDITARQRWPWTNVVDVDFTIGEANVADTFRIEVKAQYAGADREIEAKTFVSDPVVKAGKGRVSWAIGEDCPGFKAEDVRIAVTAVPFTSLTPVYMVIDLSKGKDAESYPVRYTTKDPVHTPNSEDACKMTQLWLRRIKADGTPFVMGGKAIPADNNNNFYAKLTKDYYIGVFETTQQQWFQLTGEWPGYQSNVTWRATRPLDNYYAKLMFTESNYKWPDVQEPVSGSLLKKLRNKTGLGTLNLPTEAQWQHAACAGATSVDRYLDSDGNQYALADIARNIKSAGGSSAAYGDGLCGPDKGSACVGTYKPNAFGLYDMLGNVMEDCLDPYVAAEKLKAYYVEKGYTFPLENPVGIPRADAMALNSDTLRVTGRGGSYKMENITLWTRGSYYQNYAGDDKPCARGMRFCVTCE